MSQTYGTTRRGFLLFGDVWIFCPSVRSFVGPLFEEAPKRSTFANVRFFDQKSARLRSKVKVAVLGC